MQRRRRWSVAEKIRKATGHGLMQQQSSAWQRHLRTTTRPRPTSPARPNATGATGRFASVGTQKARKSAPFRPPGATPGCELRTRNRALSLVKYRAAPPYRYSPRKDPDVLNRKPIALAGWTSISAPFHLLLLSIPCVVAEQQDTYLQQSKRCLRIETARLRTGRAVGNTVRAWPDATCCDGQCQWPQDAPLISGEGLGPGRCSPSCSHGTSATPGV
jgi:hypothetical protein